MITEYVENRLLNSKYIMILSEDYDLPPLVLYKGDDHTKY